MRASTAFLIALLFAVPAAAQDEDERPKYSKDTLMRLFANAAQEYEDERGVRYRLGTVEFRALGTDWRFNYLPIMVPMSGSGPGFNGEITNTFPDPFMLTNTGIATSPRAWRTTRQRNAELRRIERTERARIKVEREN